MMPGNLTSSFILDLAGGCGHATYLCEVLRLDVEYVELQRVLEVLNRLVDVRVPDGQFYNGSHVFSKK